MTAMATRARAHPCVCGHDEGRHLHDDHQGGTRCKSETCDCFVYRRWTGSD